MLRSLNDLDQFAVSATDGDIGIVVDFLLDEERWVLRYLVVTTSGSLEPRQLLIAPSSFRQPEWALRRFHLALTVAEAMASATVQLGQPVPAAAAPAHPGTGPGDLVRLRSATEVCGYHTQGNDAAIGHVEDFIVDDDTWAVRYLVINTSNWWVGKKVLVAPQWTRRISGQEKNLYVDLSRQQIKSSPAWNAIELINREYETRLYDYYARPGYWHGMGSSPPPPERPGGVAAERRASRDDTLPSRRDRVVTGS